MKELLETGPSPRGWHRLQNMLECPQKYAYQNILGMDIGIPAIALRKGSLAHLALAHYYNIKKDIDNGVESKWLDPFEAIKLKCEREPDFHQARKIVTDGISTYLDYWREEDQKWNILDVEQLAYATIEDPDLIEDGKIKKYLFTGRFDMIIENKATGDVYVVDHKTTSRLSNNHEKFYSMSGQLIGYEYMAKKIFGDRMKGFILNFIQLGSTFKFGRHIVPPRPNLSSQFEQTVIDTERRIAELENSKRDSLKYPKAMNELTCFSRYGACSFMDICKYGISSLS